MTRNDKEFLVFAIIVAIVGLALWIFDASDFSKLIVSFFIISGYFFSIIMKEIGRMQSELSLLRNLLWEISFGTPLKNEDRETIRTQIREINERYK